MNYYSPRQVDPSGNRPDAGKWRMTKMNDGQIWEVGHCSRYQVCPECDGKSWLRVDVACDLCESQGYVLLSPSERCPGHDTPEQASDHYREYLLDGVDYTRIAQIVNMQLKCEIADCDNWTQESLMFDHFPINLCTEHRTREALSGLMRWGTQYVSSASW